MTVHVLLNLLNKLRKRDKMRDLSSNLSIFFTTRIKYNFMHLERHFAFQNA